MTGAATITETTDPEAKAKLPPGPWQDEPDKVSWYDEATGMACLIVRNRMGALCGYVGVETGHPWHGLKWTDHETIWDIEVHGCINYSAACEEDGKICHVPAEGRAHDVWWFGFDCAHAGDVTPRLIGALGEPFWHEDIYKTVDYVRAEVAGLARQLADVGS